MSLSPWDLSGNISFDFSLYRPRRPSYVYATQIARRRNESYRHATKSESVQGEQGIEDFIEGIQVHRKKRKDSYKQATDQPETEHIELGTVDINHVGAAPVGVGDGATYVPHQQAGPPACVTVVQAPTPTRTQRLHGSPKQAGAGAGGDEAGVGEPDDPATETILSQNVTEHDAAELAQSRWKYRKNLIVLSLSFILVFTAFRSIQNLQSSLNTNGRLGVIAMGCVHGTMFLTCLFAPVLINKLTSKWTIVLGLLFYLFWIAANFYPHFYTLIPTSIGVGFGQSLAWGAQVTYIQKLAVDYAHLSKELTHQELAKFNGIFLACFQTTHIWGNVVSSVMLDAATPDEPEPIVYPDMSSADYENVEGMGKMGYEGDYSDAVMPQGVYCGIYDFCEETVPYVWNISNTGILKTPAVISVYVMYMVMCCEARWWWSLFGLLMSSFIKPLA